jgi:hypothetical protein
VPPEVETAPVSLCIMWKGKVHLPFNYIKYFSFNLFFFAFQITMTVVKKYKNIYFFLDIHISEQQKHAPENPQGCKTIPLYTLWCIL